MTTIVQGKGQIVPKEWLTSDSNSATPVKDRRSADQTFLTFPEWYLVFSPEEQANYFKRFTATTFPFTQHIMQFWKSYELCNNQIKNVYPTNTGYHFMIWVIGTSATAEYIVKAWHETVIGRLTDTETPVTEEDRFNAQFTKRYVELIKDYPWYEFNFKAELTRLWSHTSLAGDHMLRKIDRRYILTSELLVKYLYGKLIKAGTGQVYDVALPTTAVILNNDSLLYLPRYDRFSYEAKELSKKGYQFKEISGNRSAILLTIIIPSAASFTSQNARTLFVQPITSYHNKKRIALVTQVAALHSLLTELNNDNIFIEHTFDY